MTPGCMDGCAKPPPPWGPGPAGPVVAGCSILPPGLFDAINQNAPPAIRAIKAMPPMAPPTIAPIGVVLPLP